MKASLVSQNVDTRIRGEINIAQMIAIKQTVKEAVKEAIREMKNERIENASTKTSEK